MLTFTNDESVELRLEHDVYIDESTSYRSWKWLFDVLLATLVTLLILSWLIPVIGLLIKLTSPGPILYLQWRTGRYGRPFRCYKFRTMIHKSRRGYTPFKQAVIGDTRIIPIGKFLRRVNLDEMPQFLNVLLGDMSIVGPRPHAIQHDAEFWFSIPNYDKRYNVLPGITGLAQVRGARGSTDDTRKMVQRLKYDLFYMQKSSLLHDIQICWWTVASMFRGDPNAW